MQLGPCVTCHEPVRNDLNPLIDGLAPGRLGVLSCLYVLMHSVSTLLAQPRLLTCILLALVLRLPCCCCHPCMPCREAMLRSELHEAGVAKADLGSLTGDGASSLRCAADGGIDKDEVQSARTATVLAAVTGQQPLLPAGAQDA